MRLLIIAFLASCLVSCVKEVSGSMGDTSVIQLTATIDVEETKTSLSLVGDNIYRVLWSEGDAIGVFAGSNQNMDRFTLSEGAGTNRATFTGYVEGRTYNAYYPASAVVSRQGENMVLVELPDHQKYDESGFGNGSFPMVAYSNSDNLTFKNLASVIKIPILGHHFIDSIVFQPNNKNMGVSGRASVNTATASISMLPGAKNRVVLISPGVGLNENTAKDFYLVIPPGDYAGGFRVRIYSSTGYMDKSYKHDYTFERSRLHETGSVQFKPEEGSDISSELKGEGTNENPFVISSLEDFLLLQASVNSGGTISTSEGDDVQAYDAHYLLSNDLDLSPVCSKAKAISWKPIGDAGTRFSGVFDGGGHTISNLFIEVGKNENNGLFGSVGANGVIRNLTVEGETMMGKSSVHTYESDWAHTGLLAGHIDIDVCIENCVSKGSVEGDYWRHAGGLVGESYGGRFVSCINYANVSGVYTAGGICGSSYPFGFTDCINYGTIQGNRAGGITGDGGGPTTYCINYGVVEADGDVAGGIIAYHNNGDIFNCINTGKVSSVHFRTGGIAGLSMQGGLIINCINKGVVSGVCGEEWGNVGGICGEVSDFLSTPLAPTSVYNCVNLGIVKPNNSVLDGAKLNFIGGIAGRNEVKVVQNYWLYDAGKGLGLEKGIGTDVGDSSNNYALTEAQVKGEDTGVPLYKTYTKLVDALNAWAANNMEAYSSSFSGWAYDTGGELSLSFFDAQKPEDGTNVFKVSRDRIELNSSSEEFEIVVTSNLAYSVSMPEWVSEVSVKTIRSIHTHTFRVQDNPDDSERLGTILFTNEEGKMIRVSLRQLVATLMVEPTSMSFSADGGSKRVLVISSVKWLASSSASWCSISSEKGVGRETLILTAEANAMSTSRNAVVTLASEDGSMVSSISVTQFGRRTHLEVAANEVVLASVGDSKQVFVSSNVKWTASSGADWCVISPSSCSGDGTVSIQAFANPSEQARGTRVIIASEDGSYSRHIDVIQSGMSQHNQQDWRILPFHHQSLAMRFTATWCGYCPNMNKTILRAQELAPRKIQQLALHTRDSDLLFENIIDLENQYGISVYPTGLMDGRLIIGNGEVEATAPLYVDAVKETEEHYGTVTGMEISSSLSGNDVSVDIKVYVKEKGDYKITVLLVEDGIVNKQTDNMDGDHASYVHDNIVRKSMTNVLGEGFSVKEDFTIKDFHYKATIPASYNKQNLRVFAYIQASFGSREAIQSNRAFGNFYVDNCATAMLGSHLELALDDPEGEIGGGTEGGDNEGIVPGEVIDM